MKQVVLAIRRAAKAASFLGLAALVNACASFGYYTGQSMDPLIAKGEAFAHSVRVWNIPGRPVVRSVTHRKGKKRLKADQFVYAVEASQPGVSISIKTTSPKYREFYQRTVDKAAPVIDEYVGRIFGESAPAVLLSLLVGDLRDVGSSSFSRPVTQDGVELIFAFDIADTGVTPPSAREGLFLPLETAAHEMYHVLVRLDSFKQSARTLDLTKAQRIALGEAAAMLFSTCVDLEIFKKSLVAHRLQLDFEDRHGNHIRHGTVSDRKISEFLDGGSKLKMRNANFFGVAIFNTIWAENVGAIGYLNRADPKSENLLALCAAEYLRRPENLVPLLREMAADGIDAPEFPDDFPDPPPSWLTPIPSLL